MLQVKIVYRWVAPGSVAQQRKQAAAAGLSAPLPASPAATSDPSQLPPPALTSSSGSGSMGRVTGSSGGSGGGSVSLDWTWMPADYFPQLRAASNSARSLLNPQGPAIHPVIVRGWGATIELLALIPPTLSSRYDPATGTSTPSSSSSSSSSSGGDMEAVILATHLLPDPVLTVKWLSNHTSVVVMTTKEVLVLNVPSFSRERLPVTKEVSDMLLHHIIAR